MGTMEPVDAEDSIYMLLRLYALAFFLLSRYGLWFFYFPLRTRAKYYNRNRILMLYSSTSPVNLESNKFLCFGCFFFYYVLSAFPEKRGFHFDDENALFSVCLIHWNLTFNFLSAYLDQFKV